MRAWERAEAVAALAEARDALRAVAGDAEQSGVPRVRLNARGATALADLVDAVHALLVRDAVNDPETVMDVLDGFGRDR